MYYMWAAGGSLRSVRATTYEMKDKVRGGIACGREHEVMLDRGWALWVRGEVATGGQDPKRAWSSVGLAAPCRRSGPQFSGCGGREKENSPVLRTGGIGGKVDGEKKR